MLARQHVPPLEVVERRHDRGEVDIAVAQRDVHAGADGVGDGACAPADEDQHHDEERDQLRALREMTIDTIAVDDFDTEELRSAGYARFAALNSQAAANDSNPMLSSPATDTDIGRNIA